MDPKKYTVLAEGGIVVGETTHAKDEVVELSAEDAANFLAAGDVAEATETPKTEEEQVQANADGEVRFTEHEGKHFWKRYDATGALVFTSKPFDTEEEAKADAEAAA